MKKRTFALITTFLLTAPLISACYTLHDTYTTVNNIDNNETYTAVPVDKPSKEPEEDNAQETTTEAPGEAPSSSPEPTPTKDPDTWDYDNNSDVNMLYTEPEDTPDKMPYEIHVNKQMNCITVYKADKKGRYTKPVKAMVCSAGSKTPLGTFHTSTKYYWKAMIHEVWAQYATRITGDILFHSVPYDDHEKNTLITSYYNRLGSTASAGCIRLSVKDAKWILENCPSGTTVVIYNSSDAGPLGKPSPIRIPLQCKWDPTDPDSRNPLKSKKSTITGVKDRTVERGQYVNCLENVTAFDKNTFNMSTSNISVSTKLNVKKPGTYKVRYKFKDSKGKVVKKTASFTVEDTTAPVISGLPEKYYVRDADKINKDSIYKAVSVTDNGYALSKKDHLTVDYSENKAVITATDDYGHTKTLNVEIIEDNTPPVLVLKNNQKTEYPISQKIDESFARNRIKTVSDDIAKLNTDSPKITIKPNGWGVTISYDVYDHAGNRASAKEIITFEKVRITLPDDTPTVKNIKSDNALKKLISVVSEKTGRPVKYSVKIKRSKIKKTKGFKLYKINYSITYSSAAGSKNTIKTLKVKVPD